ncbi:MAG: molybdopterin molybdotransferase MoeA, partial [Candidatus Latescibacterota bacterium]
MISLQEAMAIADEHAARRRVPAEMIAVREATGRVLARDQKSRVDQPPFDRSAVDGYAVTVDDPSGSYRVAGVISAGEPGMDALSPGSAAKVMTGAPVPPGSARVIMVEQAVEKDGEVRFENPSAKNNICRKAEDIAVGDIVLAAGSRIGVLEMINLLGCGISELDVARVVRIAVLSTGDELVDSVSKITPGKIMNTNGPMLSTLARMHGLQVAVEEAVSDDPVALSEAIRRALAAVDIVVLSGGVSMGDFDYVPQAISRCGLHIHFDRVAVKPG